MTMRARVLAICLTVAAATVAAVLLGHSSSCVASAPAWNPSPDQILVEPAVPPGQLPAGKPPFVKSKRDGAKGGQLVYGLPGTVDDVVAMMLDFGAAVGRRPWARSYRVIEKTDNRVVAEWKFDGRMGVNPKVEIEFEIDRGAGNGEATRPNSSALITFKLRKRAFGLARFFGQHYIAPLNGSEKEVWVSSSKFIDSGIFITNASHKDVEDGLRADATAMHKWMRERLATKVPQ